jgi:hypothetical protein
VTDTYLFALDPVLPRHRIFYFRVLRSFFIIFTSFRAGCDFDAMSPTCRCRILLSLVCALRHWAALKDGTFFFKNFLFFWPRDIRFDAVSGVASGAGADITPIIGEVRYVSFISVHYQPLTDLLPVLAPPQPLRT